MQCDGVHEKKENSKKKMVAVTVNEKGQKNIDNNRSIENV
jgi:G3E family GTPase